MAVHWEDGGDEEEGRVMKVELTKNIREKKENEREREKMKKEEKKKKKKKGS